jgi:5-methylcytosine-specific restriction endonuclease McrA
MEQTLVLNATFEPLKVIGWQRAMTLWAQGKVEIVETHDREVRAVSFSFMLPSVVRLLYFIMLKKRPVIQFTRANIYTRDDFTCQYCGEQSTPEKLTFDHVVPSAYGGTRNWENIVTACEPCNKRKGARTPEEAGMTLRRRPVRPLLLPTTTVKVSIGFRTPENWLSYLYWNVELER